MSKSIEKMFINNIHNVVNMMIASNMYCELNAILKFYAKTSPEFYDRNGFLTINGWLDATESVKDKLYDRQRLVDALLKLFGEDSEYS